MTDLSESHIVLKSYAAERVISMATSEQSRRYKSNDSLSRYLRKGFVTSL